MKNYSIIGKYLLAIMMAAIMSVGKLVLKDWPDGGVNTFVKQ